MSGPSSYHEHIVRLDAASMEDDQPVSVYRAWELQQNLQHLIDMSPQHRINWSSTGNDDAHLYTVNVGTTRYWSMPFVHTWLDPRWPCGLDIHIVGSVTGTGSPSVAVSARIVPDTVGLHEQIPDPYWSGTGTITTASSDAIDDIFYPDTTTQARAGWRTFTVRDGSGNAQSVVVCLSRLDVTMTLTGGLSSYTYGLTRVLVREFC